MATHWGWYWKVKQKHISRKLCSQLPSIDSFKLYKNNALADFTVSPLNIRAQAKSDHLAVTYRNQKNCSYNIPVDKLACNYGGLRCFFRCPLCNQRMRFLYLAENSLFLCRKCLNLSYKSQQLRPSKRYTYMQQKTKGLIEKKGGNIFYKKPPKMHKKSYALLKDKHCEYEIKYHQAFTKELQEWYGDRIKPFS